MIKKLKQKEMRNNFTMIAALALLFLALVVIINYSKTQTSYAILGIETNYIPNETLKGNILLSLKPGELIPKDSIVSIKIKDEKHSYPLSQLISESANSGYYYIEDKSLSGSGEGYGKAGERKIYPDVTFTLKISKSNSEGNAGSDFEEQNNLNSENAENISSQETPPAAESAQETNSETAQENQESTISEASSEPVQETTTESSSEPAPQETTTESSSEPVQETGDSSQPESSPAPITGAVTSKIDLEIQGVASKNNPYTYNLKNKQTAEIILSSQPVNLNINEDVAVITTDYYETEEGFGSEYITDSSKYEIKIDLAQLNILPEEGEVIVSIIWENESIAEVATNLNINEQSKKVMPEENVTNQTAFNQTITNQTLILPYDQIENISAYALTEQEKLLLNEKAGASAAEIKSAQEKNGRAIVKFVLGSYWLEKSYEYPNPSIKNQIELDKARWVKSIASELIQPEPSSAEISELFNEDNLEEENSSIVQ